MPIFNVAIVTDPCGSDEAHHVLLKTTDRAEAEGLHHRLELAGLNADLDVTYLPAELDAPDLQNSLVSQMMADAAGDWGVRTAWIGGDIGWQIQMFLKPQEGDDKVGIQRDKYPIAIIVRGKKFDHWKLTEHGHEFYRDTGCLENTFGEDLASTLDRHYSKQT